jgi:hypothetical protein
MGGMVVDPRIKWPVTAVNRTDHEFAIEASDWLELVRYVEFWEVSDGDFAMEDVVIHDADARQLFGKISLTEDGFLMISKSHADPPS